MVKVFVTRFYYSWRQAEVEVEPGDDGEVLDDDVYDAVDEQEPEFKEYEDELMGSSWEFDWREEEV